MCGIVGLTVRAGAPLSRKVIAGLVRDLYRESESRGKEASGVAVHTPAGLRVHKEARPASFLLASATYKELVGEFLAAVEAGPAKATRSPALIGHTRLTTNGAQGIPTNNQPVVRDGAVAIHNGIIVNVDRLWQRYAHLGRKTEVDTEVLVALLRHRLREGASLEDALRATFAEVEGTASIALLQDDLDDLVLATNTGSLYVCTSADAVMFASERSILERVAPQVGHHQLRHLAPGQGLVVSLRDLAWTELSFGASGPMSATPTVVTRRASPLRVRDSWEDELTARASLRRCARCILPETFPFIAFDAQGVCNYCASHVKQRYLGKEALEAAVAPFRRQDGEAECLIAFSGGRDSCFSLHYLVNELKLRPIVYTYDWGMVNDLARRNQARLCGKLGIEQILVSADIKRKRENIGMNVRAWLRKPDLGTIPLFMAGDKQFFYYAKKVSEQTRIPLTFWAINELERTNFKVGFCGIRPPGAGRIYGMGLWSKLRMALYYARRFAANPAYLNRSLRDTAFAFMSYYMMKHEYLSFFDYVPWNEDQINDVLIKEYDWELSPDTPTTWRIGDETAAFYNYIYTTIAGFSENDTFRSNQVREGLLTRERALQIAEGENAPRWESIKRYLALINVDFDHALSVINALPKLYLTARA